jgi:hypothetical protein
MTDDNERLQMDLHDFLNLERWGAAIESATKVNQEFLGRLMESTLDPQDILDKLDPDDLLTLATFFGKLADVLAEQATEKTAMELALGAVAMGWGAGLAYGGKYGQPGKQKEDQDIPG